MNPALLEYVDPAAQVAMTALLLGIFQRLGTMTAHLEETRRRLEVVERRQKLESKGLIL